LNVQQKVGATMKRITGEILKKIDEKIHKQIESQNIAAQIVEKTAAAITQFQKQFSASLKEKGPETLPKDTPESYSDLEAIKFRMDEFDIICT